MTLTAVARRRKLATPAEADRVMSILIRHILIELSKVFLLSLAVLTALMIIVGLVREAINQNLPPAQVIWLIPYILPDALRIMIPVTLLLATTVVYGRMSGGNEVVAIKAMGISPVRIIWPALVAAFLISLVTVWLNEVAVSWARQGAQRVVVNAVEEIVYNMLRTQRRYNSSAFAINVRRLEDRKLIYPTLTLYARGNTPSVTIMAREAELRADHAQHVLKIVLREGTVNVGGRITGYFPDTYEHEVPLSDASRADGVSGSPSATPLNLIPERIARQHRVIEQFERELAARAACQMLCGEFDTLTGPEWDKLRRQMADHRQHLSRLYTESPRRWAAGFSCLCFVWIGAPMAVWLRQRDFLTSFFVCFTPILVVYYPLLVYGIDGAKNGTIPPYSVWAGNLILFAWGCYLLRKVVRY